MRKPARPILPCATAMRCQALLLAAASLATLPLLPALAFGQATKVKTKKREAAVPETVQVLRDIQYVKTVDGPLALDLYRPKEFQGRLPVIVFVHGGGWKNGSKTAALRNAVWLVPDGYAIASIDYRLTDVAKWPAQINDCYAAVRWVRDNADRYDLDPKRVVAWGSSAGGHLVALMGTRRYDGEETTDSRVQAVIDWFGPADLLTMPPNVVSEKRTIEQVSKSNGALLLGETVRDAPELARDASALHNVSKDDPPFLIMHGDQDPGVPIEQSRRLAEHLKEQGVDVELVPVKGAGHGGKEFQTQASRNTIRAFLKSTL